MTFFRVMIANIQTPFCIVAILAILACAVVGGISFMQSQGGKYGDPQGKDAADRAMLCLQCGIILAVMGLLVWSIPKPNYDVRDVTHVVYVEKKVPVVKFTATRVVTHVITNTIQPRYQTIFDDCMSRVANDADTNAQCHKQALEVLSPPRVVERRYIQHDNYKTIFDACNDFNMDDTFKKDPVAGAKLRNDRLMICHKAAMEGSHAH